MQRILLLFFCLCVLGISHAQEKTLLHGEIVFSSMSTSPINIINLNTYEGTYNDEKGRFRIHVSLGDTVLFSSIQYKPYRLIVDEAIVKKRWVRITLVPSVEKLDPVLVTNYGLTGVLGVDAVNKNIKKAYVNSDFGFSKALPLPPEEERRLYTLKTSMGGIPLLYLIASISGQLKRAKAHKKLADTENFIEKAFRSMPVSFFVETCGIPQDYIYSFMYFCDRDERFRSIVNNDLAFKKITFFTKKAKVYKKERKKLLAK